MTENETTPDLARRARTGIPEVVYAEGKAPDVVIDLLTVLHAADGLPALATRCSDETLKRAEKHFGSDAVIDPVARTITVGIPRQLDARVVIVTAGTTDVPAARECRNALHAFGIGTELVADIGVAGLHRLLDRIDHIRSFSVVIVLAGMDGVLPGVVAGLVSAPVVAVPTSVGYGVAQGGSTALNTMLASCSPGLAVVNIDNGLGAAALAARILGSSPCSNRHKGDAR